MSKPRKAPEGAKPSASALAARELARPYNLSYAQGWEDLFHDTAKMVTETEDDSNFEAMIQRRHHIRDAWGKITKGSLIPPRDLYAAENWKRG